MNIFYVNRRDIKVLLFIRPPFMVLLCYVLFGPSYFHSFAIFISATIAAIIIIILTWLIHVYADHFFRNIFFIDQHSIKRIFLSALLHFSIGLTIISLLLFWADQISFLGYQFNKNSYFSGLLVVFCTNLAATGFQEGVYMFDNWKKTLIEAEELKKLMLKNRLNGLRNQTSPHFFFDNIHTLSDLITIDPINADQFLNEMCRVYRYLLRNEQAIFQPLYQELSFIQSWIHIIHTRYKYAVKFTINQLSPGEDMMITRLTILRILEHIIGCYINSPHHHLDIILTIKEHVMEISYPILVDKVQTIAVSEDYMEVKTIHRLLGLPEISERRSQIEEFISIPLLSNTVDYEYL